MVIYRYNHVETTLARNSKLNRLNGCYRRRFTSMHCSLLSPHTPGKAARYVIQGLELMDFQTLLATCIYVTFSAGVKLQECVAVDLGWLRVLRSFEVSLQPPKVHASSSRTMIYFSTSIDICVVFAQVTKEGKSSQCVQAFLGVDINDGKRGIVNNPRSDNTSSYFHIS